jgi:signal transduction histidine kinase
MDDLLRDLNKVLSVRSTLEEKMQMFLISEVISLICVNLKKEIDESGAKINVAIDHSADPLTSIKSYIQSALFNLVGNAIKYRSPDRSPVISIRGYKYGGHTVISIEDNGLGIDLNADKDKIFMLYGRLHHDREGKGLGLYMTKTQIESLKGTIEIESQKGRGTTFTITL